MKTQTLLKIKCKTRLSALKGLVIKSPNIQATILIYDCHRGVCDILTRVQRTFCNTYQPITNKNFTATEYGIRQNDNRKGKSHIVKIRIYFCKQSRHLELSFVQF